MNKKTLRGWHKDYIKELTNMLERHGYKVIVEGSIPKYRGKGWAEPDLFVLKKEGTRMQLEKIIEVTISDKKEGPSTKTTTTVEDKIRKIREYYDPPELIVFEPRLTAAYYDLENETKGKFKDYDKYVAYLQEKWNQEGLNVIFWNEDQLEDSRERAPE